MMQSATKCNRLKLEAANGNPIHHQEWGYTILVFARDQKRQNNVTVPFTYLGPVDMASYENDRPIYMAWLLRCRIR
jgi:hypothetical protein